MSYKGKFVYNVTNSVKRCKMKDLPKDEKTPLGIENKKNKNKFLGMGSPLVFSGISPPHGGASCYNIYNIITS